MKTITKILIGTGSAIVLSAVIFFGFTEKGKEISKKILGKKEEKSEVEESKPIVGKPKPISVTKGITPSEASAVQAGQGRGGEVQAVQGRGADGWHSGAGEEWE